MRGVSAAAVAAVAIGCGGADYDQRFTPSSAPGEYIPVTIERGALRADCRFSHFELRIPPDAPKVARAKPEGDRSSGWRLAVPKQRIGIATVCDLTYGGGTRFRFSTVVDATSLDRVACAHRRSGHRSERHPPGSRRGRGVVLVCTNDDPALRSGGVAGEGPAAAREAVPKDYPPPVEEFHQVMGPLWHAAKDPARAARICDAVPALRERAGSIAKMVRPETAHGSEQDWVDATARLVDRVRAVEEACRAPERPDVELEFEGVHDAYHGVASLLHHEH